MRGESDFLDRLWSHVLRFTVAIDGGANIGEWSARLATRFRTVLAVEPYPPGVEHLERRFENVANVSVVPIALGDRVDKVGLVGRSHSSMYVDFTGGDTQMMTIDSLRIDDVGLIKLDLEGADCLALRGARETLKRCKPLVIVESIPRFERRFGLNARAPLMLLVNLGFEEVARARPNHAFAWPV